MFTAIFRGLLFVAVAVAAAANTYTTGPRCRLLAKVTAANERESQIGKFSAMSLTLEALSDAWLAAAAPVPVSCTLRKLSGQEGDAVDVCLTFASAEQRDFKFRCACIFLIDNR
jgi:hypothetical protein